MVLEVGGVHHIAIKTRQVARLADFYKTTLRLEETSRNVDAEGLRSVWMSASNTIVMIERSASTPPAPRPAFADDPPGLHLIAFRIRTDDHERWMKRLEDHKINVLDRTSFTTYFEDPDGNRIGLSTWPEALEP